MSTTGSVAGSSAALADHGPETAAQGISAAEAEAVARRAEKRKVKAKQRNKAAEALKEQGNSHFRAGEYLEAIELYEQAMQKWPDNSVYAANCAAAWLKLEEYDRVLDACLISLIMDPRNVKARYRRAIARKFGGFYKSAMVDLSIARDLEPNDANVRAELLTVQALYDSGEGNDYDLTMQEAAYPPPDVYDDDGDDQEERSSSSDDDHEGNGIACKFYNHDGCTKGAACAYSHAPDELSRRDKLGKNVCLYYLLGECKFGAEKCNYSHDKRFLPNLNFWNDKAKVAQERDGILVEKEMYKEVVPPKRAGSSSSSSSRPSRGARGRGNGRGRARGGGRGGGRGRATRGKHRSAWDDNDDELEERMMNHGFSNSEVEELLCQGVKPWDDDAWDVMNVLNGNF
ncbi:hypothetical protein PLICRDRAFT_171967 [Plicaturopsis crispa FD-325 SS-3]|nr:hypothetical protein PLICRDRAFT_171967 [Plicaturopsis crispa FD-325 SS-3]